MHVRSPPPPAAPRLSTGVGYLVWALAWLLMWLVDGRVELGSQALILVLGATLSALCWRFVLSLLVSALAVVGFNFAFVSPRGALGVDVHQHALLLLTMLVVTWTVSALVSRLRSAIDLAQTHARRSDELRQLGDRLRREAGEAAAAQALKPLLDTASDGQGSALLIAPAEGSVIGSAMFSAAVRRGTR